MANISGKAIVLREATAQGTIMLQQKTIGLIKKGKIEKGNPVDIANIAGIAATKLTPTIMPLCHPIPIENVKLEFQVKKESISVKASVRTHWKTGVEMEALSAVTAALLNIWDVVKKYEKDKNGQYPTTKIYDVSVVSKVKGKDG
ncbi:MAG: cyclic pyranopterin monophosphate synthase MoaC [Thaumarchaeota archaeon]|nr:cyclic pyranopterin monophosphate synthase MoaC [Nitrososphaerota archaeon]MCZ6616369.1 cyclic pyranopterin monophosphate synthase MoaC [Nitrososphaerota archaeon]MCZ6725081.1 cyclic pyranopterin monophosphate synthase MoaC [Nitrososphaerota archaeon]